VDRRDFLKVTAAGAATVAFPTILSARAVAPKAKVVRVANDRFELVYEGSAPVRILQLTDTHFGRDSDKHRASDVLSQKLIRQLVDEQKPALVFHTGDFINNDLEKPDHSAIGFMNDLGTPWSLVFGNHDHAQGREGGISLDDYYGRLENHATGFIEGNGKREYAYRIDIRKGKEAPGFSLFGFNCGNPVSMMKVTDGQIAWLKAQLEEDKRKGHTQPILVMQHIPMIEYKTLYDAKDATGRQGEKVCFEQDNGSVFETYRQSGRVHAVFCGHDHVNDYLGRHKEILLAYGRVSGWSGYGDWQRGGRVIDMNLRDRTFRTRVVLPSGAVEKPEWAVTMKDLVAP
jgi:3',5'-cyclic AMP phosphodiesterase CpdA